MSQMIDWEYYDSHFPTPIPEKKFAAVETQAEIEFSNVVPEYLQNQITIEKKQNCVFQLCNFLYSNQAAVSGKAVTSVSNNGYSESYAFSSPDQMKLAMRELIYECIGTRLAGVF